MVVPCLRKRELGVWAYIWGNVRIFLWEGIGIDIRIQPPLITDLLFVPTPIQHRPIPKNLHIIYTTQGENPPSLVAKKPSRFPPPPPYPPRAPFCYHPRVVFANLYRTVLWLLRNWIGKFPVRVGVWCGGFWGWDLRFF